jgi:predicted helicase
MIIRFAQWRIEQTGYGVLAFVTNNGYLDNPTIRGMRLSLMQCFDDIYLLNLHGSSKKKEKAEDGGKDENVFDIQQGVAIGLFVKPGKVKDKPAQVYRADFYGTRESKYAGLAENDVSTTHWQTLKPQAPFYLFVSQDETVRTEYEQGCRIADFMPVHTEGFKTHRDGFAIDFDQATIEQRMRDMLDKTIADSDLLEKYELRDNRDWQINSARKRISGNAEWQNLIVPCAYRPFDLRSCYFDETAMDYPRRELKEHVVERENISLISTRNVEIDRGWEHVLVSQWVANNHSVSIKETNYVFPLYLYSTANTDLFDENAEGNRRPNLAPEFIADFSARLQLTFVPDGCGDLRKTFGPKDVFHYAYAMFHSPTYRSRYAEFLKIDFPRLPLTRDVALFRSLCALGKELVALHLMESSPPPQPSPGGRGGEVRFPEAGDNTVEVVRYSEPSNDESGRVWINQKQYFDNVPPEVWGYHIGGYQVCQKWLKDR